MKSTITLNNKLIDHIQDSLKQDRKRLQTIDDIIAEAKRDSRIVFLSEYVQIFYAKQKSDFAVIL